MKRSLKLMLVLAALFSAVTVTAQNAYQPIEDFQLILKHTGKTYQNNPKKEIEDTDSVYVVCSFKVNDWKDLSKFHVKLGTPQDESKKSDLSINVKNPGPFPKGVKYNVHRDMVYVTFGIHREMKKYKATIVAENAFGTKSNALTVEKNK